MPKDPSAPQSGPKKPKAFYKKQAFTSGQYEKVKGGGPKGKGRGEGAVDDRDKPSGSSSRQYSQTIRAPGVWISCTKGKERKCGLEMVDLFNSLADEIYPDLDLDLSDDEGDSTSAHPGADKGKGKAKELTVEEELKREVEAMNEKGKKAVKRFAFVEMKVDCVLFLSMKKPMDPVKLVHHYLSSVLQTGNTRSKFLARLVPCQAICSMDLEKIVSTTRHLLAETSTALKSSPEYADKALTWRLNINSKMDGTVKKHEIIAKAEEMSSLKVVMEDADLVVGMEMYKGMVGIGVMTDYDKLRKYNAQEVAATHDANKQQTDQPQRESTPRSRVLAGAVAAGGENGGEVGRCSTVEEIVKEAGVAQSS